MQLMKMLFRLSILLLCLTVASCGDSLTLPSNEEAGEIISKGIGFPRVRSAEVPVEVDRNDWQSAFSVGNDLNLFYKAGLVTFTEPGELERIYHVELTELGRDYLLDEGKLHRGGTYKLGFYRVKLAVDHFDQVFNVKDYKTYEGPTGNADMHVSDITYGWIPTDVTRFGTALGIRENEAEKTSSAVMWWGGEWKYMSR